MNPTFLLWLGAAMATFLGAATVSRAYVDNGKLWVLLASLALYCIGNLMMVKLMREGGLGLAISASAIAQLVLINVIAFFLFGERLSAVQTAGVALGVLSMALMLYPAKGGA
jgi:drug/metabolite transporter (DMT)-like permease